MNAGSTKVIVGWGQNRKLKSLRDEIYLTNGSSTMTVKYKLSYPDGSISHTEIPEFLSVCFCMARFSCLKLGLEKVFWDHSWGLSISVTFKSESFKWIKCKGMKDRELCIGSTMVIMI